MSTTEASTLTYDVFVNDPPPQDGVLPNGEPKRFSPTASTLIYGSEDAVLTDPGLTEEQARVLGDWVGSKGRNLTDIFITHGHGDHWFAAQLLAERFGARVVASAGTIEQMHGNVATRSLLWDKVYTGIPPSPVTAVTVPAASPPMSWHMAQLGLRQRSSAPAASVMATAATVALCVRAATHKAIALMGMAATPMARPMRSP